MAVDFSKGITVASGFGLQALAPLDVRSIVETIEDRNSLITDNAAPEGLVVYVKEVHAAFVRTDAMPSDEDYSACWRIFSTNDTSADPTAEAVLTTAIKVLLARRRLPVRLLFLLQLTQLTQRQKVMLTQNSRIKSLTNLV